MNEKPLTPEERAFLDRMRTPEERELLAMMIRDRGQAYVDEWRERILRQARDFGDLDPITVH